MSSPVCLFFQISGCVVVEGTLDLSVFVRHLDQPVHTVIDISDTDAIIALCLIILRPDFFDQVPVSVIKTAFYGTVRIDRPDPPAVRIILIADLPSVRHPFAEDITCHIPLFFPDIPQWIPGLDQTVEEIIPVSPAGTVHSLSRRKQGGKVSHLIIGPVQFVIVSVSYTSRIVLPVVTYFCSSHIRPDTGPASDHIVLIDSLSSHCVFHTGGFPQAVSVPAVILVTDGTAQAVGHTVRP